MSMTSLNPGLIFPEDLSGPAGTGSGDNELVLWRAIKALQAQLAGANSPLVAFFGDGSPNGTEFIGQKSKGCAGPVLVLGPQFQITTGDNVLSVDTLGRQVGVNTCTPTFALDVNEQNCDSKVIAVRGPTSDVDEDWFPNFCPTAVARIRVHNTANCSGPMQFFIADTSHVLNEVMELKANKQVEFFGQIQIDGGSPGANKILTSDAVGLASWQTPASIGIGTVSDTPNGAINQVSFFTAAHTITGDGNFLWDNSTKLLKIGTGGVAIRMLHLQTDGVTPATGVNIFLSHTGAAVDTKNWQTFITSGGLLNHGLVDDAVATATPWLRVQRSGMILTSVNIGSSTTKLFWDDVNTRLGIGTATPGTAIDSIGSINVATGYRIANAAASGNVLSGNGTDFVSATLALADISPRAHATLTSLTADDHTQYFLLAGRAGGQTAIGGTAASDPLTLQSTSNATRGNIVLDGLDLTFTSTMRARMAGQNRFRHLNSMVEVRKDTDQTAQAVNTWNVVTFDAEDFDTDNLHSTVSNTSRLTAVLTGKYLFNATVFNDDTGATVPVNDQVKVLKNGDDTVWIAYQAIPDLATVGGGVLNVSGFVSLAAGDYIEIFSWEGATSGTYKISSTQKLTRFGMAYVGE